MTQIHATGTHESHHRAERATVLARVTIASTDRARSISDATVLHNWIAARAQQLRDSGDATWHSADAPSTSVRKSYQQGKGSKVIIEHVTMSRIQIKLSNLELVGALVEELSNAGASTDVTWALTEVTKRAREREARKAAVGEAREVANDYADALGERVARVVSISDGPQNFGYVGGVARSAAASFSADSAEVSIAEITVSASVQGVFESE